jgi:plasmid replication initiation protein
MNAVVEQHSKAGVIKVLDNLPKDIDDIYDQAMERIERQPKADKELAERVLSWITYARRPLRVEELQHALTVSPEMANMDASALIFDWKLTSVCAGLVVIDEKQRIIRLTREWSTHGSNNMFRVHSIQTTQLSSILKNSANPDFRMLKRTLRQHASDTFHSTYLRVATAMTMRLSTPF